MQKKGFIGLVSDLTHMKKNAQLLVYKNKPFWVGKDSSTFFGIRRKSLILYQLNVQNFRLIFHEATSSNI